MFPDYPSTVAFQFHTPIFQHVQSTFSPIVSAQH